MILLFHSTLTKCEQATKLLTLGFMSGMTYKTNETQNNIKL